MTAINPIKTVDGQALAYVPSVYSFSMYDVSASDAGRTENTEMQTERLGTCVKFGLEWHYVKFEVGKAILKQFMNQYIQITYYDALTGDYRTSEFYRGDVSAEMYSGNDDIQYWSSIKFNLIERKAADRNV